MTLPLARRERHALCDTALAIGPDAPTLDDGWRCRDLLAHLVVREHTLLGAAGIALPPFSRFTDRDMGRLSRQPFEKLVARVRDPGLTPYAIPVVEKLANTAEYFIHHEDLRRAQATWEPRPLEAADEDALWQQLGAAGRLSARKAGVPLVARRSDRPGTSLTLLRGDDPVTVTGRASELVLLLSGRRQVRDVEWDGPPEAVARLQSADTGF